MTKREYSEAVLSVLRRVTPRERAAIRAEIDAHIEDHMEGLLELGYDEALAEERALSSMGDPEEVGRALDRQYPLFWLLVSRGAAALLALTACAVLLSPIVTLSHVWDNLWARTAPMSHMAEAYRPQVTQELDLRANVGSDVLYIYATGRLGQRVCVHSVRYDRNPLRYVSNWDVSFEDCRGEPLRKSGGSSYSAAVSYYDDKFDLPYGDPYLTAVVERFGERTEIRVPLVWEVEE